MSQRAEDGGPGKPGLDQTNQGRSPADLLRECQNLRRILDGSLDVIWTTDMSLRFTYVSPSVTRLRGVGVAEAMTQTLDQILCPASLGLARQALAEEVALARSPHRDPMRTRILEFEEYRRDGTTVWTENVIGFIWSEQQEPIGLRGITRDISVRRTAQEALRRQLAIADLVTRFSARLVSLSADELDGGIIDLLGELGTFLQVDNTFLELASADRTTYSRTHEWCAPGVVPQGPRIQNAPTEQLAWAVGQLFSGKPLVVARAADLPPEAMEFRRFLETTTILSVLDVPIVGRGVFALIGCAAKQQERAWDDEDLRVVRLVGDMVTNALGRKLAEEQKARLENQLRQAQKMESIGRLAGGIAHDFNNTLTGIIGNVSLALLDTHREDPLYRTLHEVGKAAESAAVLVRQLLAFSRQQIIEPRVLVLNEIVGGLQNMLARLIGEDIELNMLPGADLGRVKVDPVQVEEIIVNLAVNARDAMPDGGSLTVETANVVLDEAYCKTHMGLMPGEYVLLAISDTGHGMSEEVKRHLFEPFFTTKEKGKGTGLGLAMVFGAVKQNSGYLEVYSEQGHGTTFKVYFPRVHEPEEARPTRTTTVGAPRGSEIIFLVEDEPMVADLAYRLLTRLGYRVFSNRSAGEALLAARQYPGEIHLLMTDVVMPGINGRALAEELAAQRPGIKVLFTSGYTENVIVHRGILDSGVHFIAKPYTLEALAKKVREALGDGPAT